MPPRAAGLYGIAATALFAAALLGFAEAYPGYSHATKAVSELGAIGAPHAFAWNVAGFLVPGLLLAFHGWGLGSASQAPVAATLFALSGLAFAATSVPADMADMSARTSQIHVAASAGVFAAWLLGALYLGYTRSGLQSSLARWAIALATAAAAVRFSGLLFPGTGQRLAFGAHFLWVLVSSIALVIVNRSSSD